VDPKEAEMSDKKDSQTVERKFEQPQDTPSFFIDYVHVIGTGNAVILSLYEPIPGSPDPSTGKVSEIRSRLRATVHMTPEMARLASELLQKQASRKPT
jgi:hypothetical protein